MDTNKINKFCKNCDYPLENCNKYCTNCGQKDLDKKISILDFIQDFFANFYAFDSKVLTSLKYLFAKPGMMAKEYVEGKRLKFVNPFKLLLSLAIILGLLISLSTFIETLRNNKIEKKTSKKDEITNNKNDSLEVNFSSKGIFTNDKTVKDTIKKIDTTWLNKKKNIFFTKENVPKPIELKYISVKGKLIFFKSYLDHFPKDTYQDFCLKNNYNYNYWDHFIYKKLHSFYSENIEKEITDFLKSNFPYFLFLCLTFFAFVMKVFFFGSSFNFTEHLIFIFYLFCFYLLPFIFLMIAEIFYLNEDVMYIIFSILFLYNYIYFYKSLKNFYSQNKLIFKIKFVLLSFVMPLVLGFSIFIIIVLSVLLS